MNGFTRAEDMQMLSALIAKSDSSSTKNSLKKQNITEKQDKTESKKNNKDIWDDDEIIETDLTHDDGRIEPEYSVKFSQNVYFEDMFLGLSGRTHSIMDANEIVVQVKLDGIQYVKEITLNCTSTVFDIRTNRHKLVLPLQKKVDEKKGKAEWNSTTHYLKVSAPLLAEWEQ